MLAILDCRTPVEAEAALIEFGHSTLRLPPHPRLSSPVASHPDMLLFFAPQAIYCTGSYAKIAEQELLKISKHLKKEIRTVSEDYSDKYPKDVLLNAVPIGKHLLCHPSVVASELAECFADFILPVHQGYTKCSVLPIGDRALITSDESIHSAVSRAGMDVLRIMPGHIRLDGYGYGFIGGCASFSPYQKTDTIYFCGALSSHPDAASITDFCKRHGYQIRSLGRFPLTDIGTVFLL
ncbi:MAG: hypothetical protein IJX80_04275 [Clostridia bacterium]|nr:hypothetical protein [Clostridia bacterium]